jgi:hypothetical protein
VDGRISFLIGEDKKGNMKKIFAILIMAVILTGCYEDFRMDYPYTTVAFSTATGGLSTAGELGRTVVVGEGLKLDIGVYLAGVLENKEERIVRYTIDPSLLAGTSYELMPTNYYTLSDINQMIIPAGEYIGKLTVTLDSVRFLNDPDAATYHYAIPIRLTETTADSINANQGTKILVVKYINREEGFYDNSGSFQTFEGTGEEMNNGNFTSVVQASTVYYDSVETNGVMMLVGNDYRMRMKIHSDNSVTFRKLPIEPVFVSNIALPPTELTTDYCSSWETLEAVRDGLVPPSSILDYTYPKFGNWDSEKQWGWLQYDFVRPYKIETSKVFWWSDEGGLVFPNEQYLEYHNMETDTWEEVPNAVGYGVVPSVFNVTTFDEVLTDGIRLNFKSEFSVGVSEWEVWGLPGQAAPEQAPISDVVSNGENKWDPATSSFTLNYRVTYQDETYHTDVTSKLVWRNRIRDGVNEWRR